MAVQAPELLLELGGVFTAAPLFASPVTITRGNSPFGSWPRAAKFTCEINNDTLDYDPTRPAALLYGVAGRNTRARIRMDGLSRLWAEASEWTPERTIDHEPGEKRGRSSTGLVAEGLLRRLGKWTDPLRSPMYRTISARSVNIGHWSLEEDRDALRLANSAAAGVAGTLTGSYTLAEDEKPLGAAQALKIGDGAALSGTFLNASGTSGWQVAFAFKLAAVPSSSTYEELIRWTTTAGHTWIFSITDAGFRLTVLDGAGGTVMDDTSTFGGRDPSQWLTVRIMASVSGGTVTGRYAWYEQADVAVVENDGSYSGSAGLLVGWQVNQNAWNLNGWYSHIFGVSGMTDVLLNATLRAVFNGYLGELADTRYFRLLTELGLTGFVDNFPVTGYTGIPMGPQPADTILNILKEIRDTDSCRLADARTDIGLNLRSRINCYNQDPVLELTYPGHISPPFRKAITDDGVANIVTVKNRAGGEATAVLESGPLSTLPPPSGVGEYRATVDVNVADEAILGDLAAWHLARGTLTEALYNEVTVDLVANPGLTTAARAVVEGDLITVAGAEPELLHFLVVGVTERITSGTSTITFEVEPYDIFRIGIYDDTSWRWDAKTMTLSTGYSASATAWTFAFTDARDVWSSAVPYDLMVGGERVTLTAVGALTGSGPYTQTATVKRSVNGVVKAQTAGTEAHVALARRWGL